jgi:hypothetical protein
LGKRKKSRRRKLLYWLLIDVVIAAIVFGLLFYKPSRYNPVVSTATGADSDRVHPYLHRELGSKFYNGAQSQRPFEMIVLDKGLNEAIAQVRWPQEAEGIAFSAPAVLFVPGRIVLMGTANIEGAEFVVTIELEPRMNGQKLLNLNVAKVKIGAMNITPLAKMIAKKMYQERLETEPVDTQDWRAKIAASLLNGEAFEPIFPAEDKRVRLKSFNITQGKLIAQLIPVK